MILYLFPVYVLSQNKSERKFYYKSLISLPHFSDLYLYPTYVA